MRKKFLFKNIKTYSAVKLLIARKWSLMNSYIILYSWLLYSCNTNSNLQLDTRE